MIEKHNTDLSAELMAGMTTLCSDININELLRFQQILRNSLLPALIIFSRLSESLLDSQLDTSSSNLWIWESLAEAQMKLGNVENANKLIENMGSLFMNDLVLFYLCLFSFTRSVFIKLCSHSKY